MSDSNKQKQEYRLSVKKAAGKLRTLADELERGTISINGKNCTFAADTEVRASLRVKDGDFSVKLKFKLENQLSFKVGEKRPDSGEECVKVKSTPAESTLGNYSDLKKRMSKSLKAIKSSCMAEQVLPEPDLIEQFCQDSKAMCTYPDKGEEFYETFLKQAESLYEAFKSSDLKGMSSAIESLVQSRNDCHEKHK